MFIFRTMMLLNPSKVPEMCSGSGRDFPGRKLAGRRVHKMHKIGRAKGQGPGKGRSLFDESN